MDPRNARRLGILQARQASGAITPPEVVELRHLQVLQEIRPCPYCLGRTSGLDALQGALDPDIELAKHTYKCRHCKRPITLIRSRAVVWRWS